MKKRVLQFIGSFHQGGSERQAVALTKMLKNEGSFDVFVATLNKEGVLLDEVESLGLKEITEFKLTSFYKPRFLWRAGESAKYLKNNHIDLIHTHDFYTNVFAMVAGELARVPAKIASKRETGGMRSYGQQQAELGAFYRYDAIVANSNAVKEYLVSKSVLSDKINVIYNGVDLQRFANVTDGRTDTCRRFNLSDGENVRFVMLVANLRHTVKNVPMLLRAAKRVLESQPNIHFVIAGEGELESKLRDLAKQLGVAENVHFNGRCDDVPALLSISDVCVLTSTAEGFSNSILEYMAAGKPVVATNVGGAAEAIVDGVTGFVIASDDDVSMARRLVELLDNYAIASNFGTEGKRIANEKFSQQTQLSKTIELYNALLK